VAKIRQYHLFVTVLTKIFLHMNDGTNIILLYYVSLHIYKVYLEVICHHEDRSSYCPYVTISLLSCML